MKILSIKPYASRKYANDLTTKAIVELSKNKILQECTVSFPDWDKLKSENCNVFIIPALDSKDKITSDRLETRSLIQIQITTKQNDGLTANNYLRAVEAIILSILFKDKECLYRGIDYSGSDFIFISPYGLKMRTISILINDNVILSPQIKEVKVEFKDINKYYKVV